MTHVVSEACVACKYTDCVEVCPVDAFREGELMLVIDPDECIDCGVCIPECPVDAIFAQADLPPGEGEFAELNVDLARRWPVLSRKKPALPDAEQWCSVRAKRGMLDWRAEGETDQRETDSTAA